MFFLGDDFGVLYKDPEFCRSAIGNILQYSKTRGISGGAWRQLRSGLAQAALYLSTFKDCLVRWEKQLAKSEMKQQLAESEPQLLWSSH